MSFQLNFLFSFFILTFFAIGSIDCLFRKNLFPDHRPANLLLDEIDSKPLFLTPYIESGKIDEGREASRVLGLTVEIPSYSGFLTVNSTYNSNLFFWFFPAKSGSTDVPVLLWLQGGPGGSSLFGLFVENGPLNVSPDGSLHLRDETWNREFAVLYIDNPVGTGFSFTKDDRGYSTNENDVAENLYEALRQFFLIYGEYNGNPLFLTGESYAGKYVPAIGYKIFKMGGTAKSAGINLQGLAIGDGFCDPINMFDYGHFLFQMGLVDEIQRDHFLEVQKQAVDYIKQNKMKKAAEIFDYLLDGDFHKSYFQNVTGLNFYYNILYDKAPESFNYYIKFLQSKETRKSIHVGNLPYGDQSSTVEEYLINDIMASVRPWIEELLNANIRIMFYSGQLDIIVAAPLTENFLRNVNWNGAKEYLSAGRVIYKINERDDYVAGYVRQAGNLIQVIIRNAGHILPYDQPKVALDMITKFVKNQPF